MALDCNKVTLSSGKVVLMRLFKIKHQRLAAQVAGSKVGENPHEMGIVMMEEIVRQLVVKIDDNVVDKSKMEDLDSVFSYNDYAELQMVVSQMMGASGGKVQAPKMELVSSGEQSPG